MSPSPNPTRLSRVSGILMYGIALLSATACHHRAPVAQPPSDDDTVNVGYGVQTREHSGQAVQSISAKELAKVKVRRVEELLAGRVAGVRVIPTPSGGFSIRVRGVSTFTGNSEPLYVIDGFVVEVAPGEGLNWLDPVEIERIDVLKDPAETSMYGVRGAHGVILIKTKRR